MGSRREAQDQGLPEKRCSQFSCPGFVVCEHGVGALSPDRFQCSYCRLNFIAMLDKQKLVLTNALANFQPGQVIQIGNEKMRIQSVNTQIGPHDSSVEVSGFSRGHIEQQIEYDDEDQCGKLVERHKLTRLCRDCALRSKEDLLDGGPW